MQVQALCRDFFPLKSLKPELKKFGNENTLLGKPEITLDHSIINQNRMRRFVEFFKNKRKEKKRNSQFHSILPRKRLFWTNLNNWYFVISVTIISNGLIYFVFFFNKMM